MVQTEQMEQMEQIDMRVGSGAVIIASFRISLKIKRIRVWGNFWGNWPSHGYLYLLHAYTGCTATSVSRVGERKAQYAYVGTGHGGGRRKRREHTHDIGQNAYSRSLELCAFEEGALAGGGAGICVEEPQFSAIIGRGSTAGTEDLEAGLLRSLPVQQVEVLAKLILELPEMLTMLTGELYNTSNRHQHSNSGRGVQGWVGRKR